ncbi:hypothetical protein CMO91_05785 [Candidatus Woesearchaeota archaeon]|nr:hypothetical protein [Candidatus Woesearchaeota archaeon]
MKYWSSLLFLLIACSLPWLVYDLPPHPLLVDSTEGISAEDARILQEQTITGIRAAYANELSPYPGQLSNELECSAEFQPVITDEYVLAYSTISKGVGACTHDTAKYRTLIGWKYCEELKTLYAIQYHTPKNESPIPFFESMRCP